MKSLRSPLLILLSSITTLVAHPEPLNEGSRIVVLPDNGKVFEWHGKLNRTYFIQVSDPAAPLIKWKWIPMIERGNDQAISHEIDSTADKGFFRLLHTDQTATNLETADFDNDGLSNLQEITPFNGLGGISIQTNPLIPDTDADGTSDGDERDNESDPTNSTSGGTPNPTDTVGTYGLGGLNSPNNPNAPGNPGGQVGGGNPGGPPLPSTEDDLKLKYRAAIFHHTK